MLKEVAKGGNRIYPELHKRKGVSLRRGSEEALVFMRRGGRFIEREKRRRRRMWLVDWDLPMKSSHLSSRSGRDFWSKFWTCGLIHPLDFFEK
ncbi:MAG: hypothetical protein RMI63_08985, partial [Caldimicrobium sp.]|nr:hypothetical protein [Caldimicrobium sp.]